MTTVDAVVLVLALGLLGGLGVFASRGVDTDEEWLVAGRALGFPVLLGTLVMTELNTATLLAFSGPGYAVGLWALTLPAVFLFGLLVYTLTVARRWQRLGATSVAELFGQRYGPGLQRLASASLMLAMLGFVATYLRSAGWIIGPLVHDVWGAPVSDWWTTGLLTLGVLGLTLGGGLVSVAATDFAAFCITLAVLPALAAWSWIQAGGSTGVALAFADVPSGPTLMPPAFVASLMALTALTYIASPWYGQRMFAADSEQTAVRAVGVSAVLVFFLYGCAVITAVAVRARFPALDNPELAVPTALAAWAPIGLRGLGYAVLISVAATTVSSMWNTWVAMATTDLERSRRLTVLLALFSWLLANLTLDRVLDQMILANVPIAALAPGLVGGLFWRRASSAGAWAGWLVGVLGAITVYGLFGDEGMYTWWWAFVVVPVSFVAAAVLSWVRPDSPERATAVYARVGPPLR